MPSNRIIKRYSNRKLYDTTASRYVTLDQIGEMVRAGEEVSIVDNSSKEDLTSVTLAQIIFEEEKRKKSFLPLGTLKSILQSGGEQISEFARTLKENAGKIIRKDNATEKDEKEAPEATPTEERHFFRELIDNSQKTFDELQRRVDERIKSALHGLTVPLGALQRELGDLSRRLEVLERRLTEATGGEPNGKADEPKEARAEDVK
jgi:polyhydroxyalkanoate synthesis repressor PhaR